MSHLARGGGKAATEGFAVAGVVELDRVVVVGEDAAVTGVSFQNAGVGDFGVVHNVRMDVL